MHGQTIKNAWNFLGLNCYISNKPVSKWDELVEMMPRKGERVEKERGRDRKDRDRASN